MIVILQQAKTEKQEVHAFVEGEDGTVPEQGAAFARLLPLFLQKKGVVPGAFPVEALVEQIVAEMASGQNQAVTSEMKRLVGQSSDEAVLRKRVQELVVQSLNVPPVVPQPETQPEIVLDVVPEMVRENVPENVPENVSENVPENGEETVTDESAVEIVVAYVPEEATPVMREPQQESAPVFVMPPVLHETAPIEVELEKASPVLDLVVVEGAVDAPEMPEMEAAPVTPAFPVPVFPVVEKAHVNKRDIRDAITEVPAKMLEEILQNDPVIEQEPLDVGPVVQQVAEIMIAADVVVPPIITPEDVPPEDSTPVAGVVVVPAVENVDPPVIPGPDPVMAEPLDVALPPVIASAPTPKEEDNTADEIMPTVLVLMPDHESVGDVTPSIELLATIQDNVKDVVTCPDVAVLTQGPEEDWWLQLTGALPAFGQNFEPAPHAVAHEAPQNEAHVVSFAPKMPLYNAA